MHNKNEENKGSEHEVVQHLRDQYRSIFGESMHSSNSLNSLKHRLQSPLWGDEQSIWTPSFSQIRNNSKPLVSEIPSKLSTRNTFNPFLVVLHVVSESRAAIEDIRKGDVISKFGPYDCNTFPGLAALPKLIRSSKERPIELTIGRNHRGNTFRTILEKKLVPSKWDHGAVVGIVVDVYPLPMDRKALMDIHARKLRDQVYS